MKLLNVNQGSEAWLIIRASHFCGSDAPVMMGTSKHMSRGEYIRMRKSGSQKEFTDWVQLNVIDKGHEKEVLARSIAEEIIGDQLYPATVTDDEGYLLSSLDGMTMDDSIIFEHKLANVELLAAVKAGVCPEHHIWQVVQALLITGAQKCMFAVSDGTKENFFYVWVTLDPAHVKKLMNGWKQLETDLGEYVHFEVSPAAVAEPVMSLPSPSVQVNGKLTIISNLVLFGEKLKEFVGKIDKNPSDDQAFANSEAAIKALKRAEEALESAEQNALAQITEVDAMRTLKDTLYNLARDTRLAQEKLVKARKESIRVEILQEAEKKFRDHCAVINKRLEVVKLPAVKAAFAEVMKGKKTVTSLRDAVDAELARVKIEVNSIAENMDANLRSVKELGKEHMFLFTDLQTIISKDNGDFSNLVKLRISDHDAAEKVKRDALLEKEREIIRQEEEEKARIKAAAEQAEKKRLEDEEAEKRRLAAAPVVATTTVEQVESEPELTGDVITSDEARMTPQGMGAGIGAISGPSPIAGNRTVQNIQSAPTVVRVEPPKQGLTGGLRTKPSDTAIINVLAAHFDAPKSNVVDWLIEMDLETASLSLMEAS